MVEVFKGYLAFDDYMILDIIEHLTKCNMYETASGIVEARIDALVSYCMNKPDFTRLKSDKLLQSLKHLAKIGFNLKDRKIQSLNENIRFLKSIYLEDRVSKLAKCIGYSEEGYRVWRFKDPKLKQFMKNDTATVGIDVHRGKIEYAKGKERKILFIAECRYRNKPASLKDVKFFLQKAKDLLNIEKDSLKHQPGKLTPRIGELWFVSVSGFQKTVLSKVFRIGDCVLKPLKIAELNGMLKQNNLPLISSG